MNTPRPGTYVLCCVLSLSVPPIAFAQADPPTQEQRATAGTPQDLDRREPAPIPSLGDVFKASVADFKALPSRSNLMVLGAGLAAAGAFQVSDTRISRSLSSARWSEHVFDAAATTGQFPLHIAAGFAAYGLGRVTASPRVALLGADLIRAQLLAQATTHAIKFAANRTRPDGTSYSFPSGHTSTMFATATVLQRHFGWKAGVPAYAAAAYVAAGRIEGRRHYLTDVAVGAALGVAAGRTVTVGRGRLKFEVAPMVAPGGAGVGFRLTK